MSRQAINKQKRVLKNPLWGPQIWEQHNQFQAFCFYRDIGIDKMRSCPRVREKMVEEFGEDKVPGIRSIEMWAVKNKWDERVLAYDRHLDGLRMRQVHRRVSEMQERHSTLAVAMTNLVAGRLKTLNPNDLTARDVREWMDVATRIELRARGENTESIGFNVTDGREQQVIRAKDFYQKMTLESPTLPDREKAQIIKEAFDVMPHELGLPPTLLDIQDVGDTVN